jgi:hypothetical protein
MSGLADAVASARGEGAGVAPGWKDRVARLQRDGRLSQPKVGLYPRPRRPA